MPDSHLHLYTSLLSSADISNLLRASFWLDLHIMYAAFTYSVLVHKVRRDLAPSITARAAY